MVVEENTFVPLIRGLVARGNCGGALDLIRDMVRQGVQPRLRCGLSTDLTASSYTMLPFIPRIQLIGVDHKALYVRNWLRNRYQIRLFFS